MSETKTLTTIFKIFKWIKQKTPNEVNGLVQTFPLNKDTDNKWEEKAKSVRRWYGGEVRRLHGQKLKLKKTSSLTSYEETTPLL